MKFFGSLLFCSLLALTSLAQVKKLEPAPVKVPFAKSLQMVVVTTGNWETVAGTARLYERKDENADWKLVGEGFPVVVRTRSMTSLHCSTSTSNCCSSSSGDSPPAR